ncbi:putative acyltransferase [Zalerion maritima]|uniref:Acyltransferase n=1 Tax=Zalerion maritima TaxID=339359 RepID=A0AAD5WNS6_9PEZI|nr:putative acyltransferase [Zalerion maritima]
MVGPQTSSTARGLSGFAGLTHRSLHSRAWIASGKHVCIIHGILNWTREALCLPTPSVNTTTSQISSPIRSLNEPATAKPSRLLVLLSNISIVPVISPRQSNLRCRAAAADAHCLAVVIQTLLVEVDKSFRAMASDTKAAPGTDPEAPPQSIESPSKAKDLYPMSPLKYDAFIHSMSLIADIFFREVHPRGSWKVPRNGPVLFVAAPHANQFVDALVLLNTLRMEAKRRVSLLVAQKSVHGFIGWASRQVGCVPVGRAQDAARPAQGTIYLPDPIGDPTLIRGIGTSFGEGEAGGMIFLPSAKGRAGASVDIAQIMGPEEVRVKRPFTGKLPLEQLTGRDDLDEEGNFANRQSRTSREGYGGTKFKLAPHMDQTKVYEAVFNRLRNGGCVGLFPEGGSHDRTELLPLKAGVAIMALGAMAEAPDCGLKIVPVGMNYFHAHKFRSRAVVEFGAPIEIDPELVELYKKKQRREAISRLIDQVYQALEAVTVSAPDYDTLMTIQAARRLYNPAGKKLPLPVVVELNRRLAKGYERYKDDERIVKLSENVKDYNRQLRYLNLRDHQVQYAKLSFLTVFFTFWYRTAKLVLLSVGVFPGLVLFAPVFIVSKVYSIKKAREALAGSAVKVQGKDVMATWKILVSMCLTPILYMTYACILTYLVHRHRLWGVVPDWVSKKMVFLLSWLFFPSITFAAFRFGEVGMDIIKSLRPLLLCLNPSSSYSIHQLRERREQLSKEVTDLINTLGPEMFPDFEATRLVQDSRQKATPLKSPALPSRPGFGRRDSDVSSASEAAIRGKNTTQSSRAIPKNESFSNIGAIPMFSTRPPSRNRSRSSSSGGGAGFGGFPISGFTSIDPQVGFDEVSRKIREGMRDRGMRRRKSVKMRAGASSDEAEDEVEDNAAGGEEWEEARPKKS